MWSVLKNKAWTAFKDKYYVLVVLAIVAIVLSTAAIGFSAHVYRNQTEKPVSCPQIHEEIWLRARA